MDDATVFDIMMGPIDIDSVDFQTRLQIRQIQDLTGESWAEVVAKAVAQRYYRLREAAEYLGPARAPSPTGNYK